MNKVDDQEELKSKIPSKIFRKEFILLGAAMISPSLVFLEVPKRIPGKEAIVCSCERPYMPLHHDELPENPIQSGSPMIRSAITTSTSTAIGTPFVY